MPDNPPYNDELDTIAELFRRDPFHHSRRSIERIVEDMRGKREHFKLGGKPLAEKKPVDLKELGLI